MKYSSIAEVYEDVESTTKRLEITDHLEALFRRTPPEIIDKVVYLTQGELYPAYLGIELGIAEKLAVKAVAQAAGISESIIEAALEKLGDIGETAAEFLSKRKQATLLREKLTVQRVYSTLDKVARASGSRAQETKLRLISGLLNDSDPFEGKYIIRTATGKLRLGVADMTILDALAAAFCGSKEQRPQLERAYNLTSDLGSLAETVAKQGLGGIKHFTITVGKPIRPMLAERLPSPREILEKLEGVCAAEYKYDGERLQVHKNGEKVTLFSRRLENVTKHYPDACDLIRSNLKVKDAIVECEAVAVNPNSGELMAFQELMHRRRKYGIEEAMGHYPVSLFLFDALYVDGKDLTLTAYPERRKTLLNIIKEAERVKPAVQIETDNVDRLESFMEAAVEAGCEGIISKSIASESIYQAGARGWLWIKCKRDYQAVLSDTIDLAVVGAFHGRGRRAGTYGALLLATYNPKGGVFRTVCKCGTGFTDEDLEKIPQKLEGYRLSKRHARVESQMTADVWFTPGLVLEVRGAEITLSPIHMCCRDTIRRESGLAIRFPRFTGRYRPDKAPEDSTTEDEVLEIYRKQLRSVEI